jgi:hypothetical protein
LIVPERSLAHRVHSNLCLRCVQTCHNLVRSFADFAPRMRPYCILERRCRNRQNRFDGFLCHALLLHDRPLTSKIKTKSHRSDRVRRKR